MTELRLEELSASNIVAANGLSLKPGQEQFIAPVTYSAESTVVDPATTWQRVVVLDGAVVGFVQANFNASEAREELRACIWRINVDADAQGQGVGRFAVQAVLNEARSRGFDHITVMWEAGSAGPGEFFHRIGFTDIGESAYGDIIGSLSA